MVSRQVTKGIEIFELINLDKKITKKEIEDFLVDKNIKVLKMEFLDLDDDTKNVRVTMENDVMSLAQLELLKGQAFPKHPSSVLKIHFINSADGSVAIPKPVEDEIIEYEIEYDKLLITEYTRKLGTDGMVFTNQEVIDKQRSVAGYLIKKIGLNLLKGKSVMNISLPINIFDARSLLELFVGQNSYAAILLETAGIQTDPLERIKFTTCFAMTKFHLSGAQLKPFNPILGETFQSKVLDSYFYMEQTCHHPPITNFYGFGKNYKIYGYNESEASTGANTVKVYYKGNFIVEFNDGTKHKIVYPNLKLTGTMVGSRALRFRGNLLVIDEKNDLLCHVELDPDERGFIQKFTTKKETYPDFLKGVITSISKNTNYSRKENTYTLIKKDKHIFSVLEGEFTSYITFDNVLYWQYFKDGFPKARRMAFTLPSDTTFREDLIYFRQKDEDMAQKYKIKLEEIQRGDKKARELWAKEQEKAESKKKKK